MGNLSFQRFRSQLLSTFKLGRKFLPKTVSTGPDAALLDHVKSKMSTVGNKIPAVLVATGALSPVHLQHVKNLADAKQAAEAKDYVVVASILSPSSDIYLKQKHQSKPCWIEAHHRRAITQIALQGHEDFFVGEWETTGERNYGNSYTDYPEVAQHYYDFLESKLRRATAGLEPIRVIYICGADHFKYILPDVTFQRHVLRNCQKAGKVLAAVAPRKDYELPQVSGDDFVIGTAADGTNPSSSEVRKLLLSDPNSARLRQIMNPQLLTYIESNRNDVLKHLL